MAILPKNEATRPSNHCDLAMWQ